jgi:hypothetical protein
MRGAEAAGAVDPSPPVEVEVLRVLASSYDRSTEIRAELNRRFAEESLPFRAEFADPFGGDPALTIRYEATSGPADGIPVASVQEEAGASPEATAERVVDRLRRYARGLGRSHAGEPASTLWCNPD